MYVMSVGILYYQYRLMLLGEVFEQAYTLHYWQKYIRCPWKWVGTFSAAEH